MADRSRNIKSDPYFRWVPNDEFYKWQKVIDHWNWKQEFSQAELNLLAKYLEANKEKFDAMMSLDSKWMRVNCDVTQSNGQVPDGFPFNYRDCIMKVRANWRREVFSNIYRRPQ
jgi:hypothetical protein